MTSNETTRISKFLSLVLRHQSETAHIYLDKAGWVEVTDLLSGCARAGMAMNREDLNHVVSTNAKKRFEFSTDGTRIRASQGHSVEVRLEYVSKRPPELLYHGTASRFVDSIREQGLLRGERQQVHLSGTAAIAHEVGARHGRPVVVRVRAAAMHENGHAFFLSTNGVWLTDHVPPTFIEFS